MARRDDEKFVTEYMRRNIRMGRAVEGQVLKTGRKLSALHSEIMERIRKEYPTMTARNMRKLNREIVDSLSEHYTGQIEDIDDIFQTIIEKESSWIQDPLRIYGHSDFKIVNSKTVAKIAAQKTYQGHTFNYWLDKAGANHPRRLVSALEMSYVNGATTQEVVTNLRGVLNKSRSEVETLARSYFNHAGRESRDQFHQANQDLVEGYYWLSTLDVRTTPHICGIRDGLLYDKNFNPVGHGLAWEEGPGRIHFNCRSNYITKIVGSGDLRDLIDRPAVGAGSEYQSGDNITRTGRVRKPTKRERDKGIFEVGQVSGSTKYENWLRTQNQDFVSDALGDKVLAQEFKQGKSLLDIVRQGSVNDLNLL